MAKKSKLFSDLFTRHQMQLERVKRVIADAYSVGAIRAGSSVTEILRQLEIETMGDLTRKELAGLLGELDKQALRQIERAKKDLYKDLDILARAETETQNKLMSSLAKMAEKKIDFTKIKPSAAFRTALEEPMGTGQLLNPFVDSWGEKMVEGVNATVRQAWLEGRTVDELTRAIRGTKANNYKDGLVEVSRRQAEAVARTSTQHISNEAYMNVWKANKDIVKEYQWVSTLDARTTTQCQALDGEIFDFGKGAVPPIHINCRSRTIPVLGEEWNFLDEGLTRASATGYVDAHETYFDWLKRQPDKTQEEALGTTKAALFKDGGLTTEEFRKLTVNKNWEPQTIDEMKRKDAEAFKEAGLE